MQISVDGKYYPYPNAREWFEKHHRHIQGDLYEQIGEPQLFWQVGDPMCEEINFLLESGKLTLKLEDEEHYWNAFLWGAPLSAAKDATVVFYSVHRDENGVIIDISFNFVAANEFKNSYQLC